MYRIVMMSDGTGNKLTLIGDSPNALNQESDEGG